MINKRIFDKNQTEMLEPFGFSYYRKCLENIYCQKMNSNLFHELEYRALMHYIAEVRNL